MRISIRDRTWIDLDHLRVFGPFEGLGADHLRAALRRLREVDPTNPLVHRVDRKRFRWVPVPDESLPEFLREVVIAASPVSCQDLATRLLRHPLRDRPILIMTGRGYVGFRLCHAVGDGRTMNSLIPDLLRAASTGGCPPRPQPCSPHLPLISASLRNLGRLSRHPRHLRLRRPPAMGLPHADPGRSWWPQATYHSGRSALALSHMRQWRDHHAPGVSAASMLAAAMWNAFAMEGIISRRAGLTVLIDLRRFLRPGARVNGNFSWGQYIVPRDPTDPRSVHQCLTSELSGGGAVFMMAMRNARLVLTRGQRGNAPPDVVIPTAAEMELTLTHVGRLDNYAALPWSGPPHLWHNISAPPPSGPLGITVSTSELCGTLHVNVGFHLSTFDRSAIAASVDRLCSDPVGLLESRP